MESLGELLKRLRGRRSLREASKLSGLSYSYISSLEKGEHPKTKAPIQASAESLKQLAKAYNYDYKELYRVAGIFDDEQLSKDLTPNETDFIIREIVKEYDLDLTIPGQREKLEDLIKIVLTDYTKKR